MCGGKRDGVLHPDMHQLLTALGPVDGFRDDRFDAIQLLVAPVPRGEDVHAIALQHNLEEDLLCCVVWIQSMHY